MPEEIKRGAEALKKEIDYDYLVKDISQALEDCHEGARRVRDIVMNLKTFSRQDDAERQVVDLRDSVESTIRILGQYFGPDRVVLHRDYGETPRIGCYPGQLSQVWMNLLVNAAQAMNGRGEIWLTSRVEDDRAVVTLRDNGPGIPEEIITKIFDPFFTTKEVGEGTGLGLSIIHGIIERHQGEIRVDTKVGVGTTFTVKLPLAVSESSAHINEPLGLVA
jgi:two-component system NtrC family sensor kinase